MTTPDPTARARAIMRDLAEVCRKHECELAGVQAGAVIDGNYVCIESRDSLRNGAPWSAEVEWTEYDYSDPYSPFPDKRRRDERIASTDPEEQAARELQDRARVLAANPPPAVLRRAAPAIAADVTGPGSAWLPGPPPAGFVWSAPHGDVIYCESDGQGSIRPAGTSRDWWEAWQEEWRWQPAAAPEPAR